MGREYIFSSGGYRSLAVRKDCETCGKNFLARDRDVKKGFGKYCCVECKLIGTRIERIEINCSYCDKLFGKKANKIAKFNFCCKICKDKAQRIDSGDKFLELRPAHYNKGTQGYRRRALKDNTSQSCELCGWNNNPKILQVHHIDRDRSNGLSSNLEVLCPNCHAEEHWGK